MRVSTLLQFALEGPDFLGEPTRRMLLIKNRRLYVLWQRYAVHGGGADLE